MDEMRDERRKSLELFTKAWRVFEGASHEDGKLVYQLGFTTKVELPPQVWGQLAYELALHYELLPFEASVDAVEGLLAKEEEAYSPEEAKGNMLKMIGNTFGNDYIAEASELGHAFGELRFLTDSYETAYYFHFSARAMLRAAIHVYKAFIPKSMQMSSSLIWIEPYGSGGRASNRPCRQRASRSRGTKTCNGTNISHLPSLAINHLFIITNWVTPAVDCDRQSTRIAIRVAVALASAATPGSRARFLPP